MYVNDYLSISSQLQERDLVIRNNGNDIHSRHCPERWRSQNKPVNLKDDQIYFVVEEEESKRHKREGSPVALQYKIFHFLVSCIDQYPIEPLHPRKININKNCQIMGTC